MAGRDDLRGGAGPPRHRDATAVVGPGNRAHDARLVRALLAGDADGQAVDRRRPGAGATGGVVQQTASDLLGHDRARTSLFVERLPFWHVGVKGRPRENPALALRALYGRSLLRRMKG